MTNGVPPAQDRTNDVAKDAEPAIEEQAARVQKRDVATTGDELEDLRALLFQREQQRLDALDAAMSEMEHRTGDDEALIESITPLLGDMIREKIRTNRDEMIEALYPIIGQLVMRAVTEAIRDLARNVDAQMRSALSFHRLWYYVRARTTGVSTADALIRNALSFRLIEIFLIHRNTGLVLWDTAGASDVETDDADVIAGMLTAIRDFAADTIGRDHQGQLDEIRYGDREILIETASDAYLAVVYEGFEPAGFREHVRNELIDLSNEHRQLLRSFTGEVTPFAQAGEVLAASLATFVRNRQGEQLAAKLQQTRQVHVQPATVVGGLLFLVAVVFILILVWRWLMP